jgi:hypothetical protein
MSRDAYDLRDPRLIQLVASRYRELQGLLMLPDVLFTLYMGIMMMVVTRLEDTGVDFDSWVLVMFGLPVVVFAIAYLRWLRPRIVAYYRSRFGRVPGPQVFFQGGWTYQGLILGALLADAHLPWLTIVIAFLSLGAWPTWIACRDWPYRWHWLPVVAVAALVTTDMSLMPSYHVALQHQGVWALALAVSVGCAAMGDHLLLVRTLTPPQYGEGVVHDDRSGA